MAKNQTFRKKVDKDGVPIKDPQTNDFIMELVEEEIVPDVIEKKDKKSTFLTILESSSEEDLKEFRRKLDAIDPKINALEKNKII